MAVEQIINLEEYERKNRIKRVCAYARVSTDKESQLNSFSVQVSEYKNMIMKNPNWEFAGVYGDEGKSGTNIFGRKQFMQMVEVAKAGGIDLIITKSISRFARNTVDCLKTIRELKKVGTEIYFENDNLSSFDTSIDIIISMLASIAEEESKNNSQNVIWRYENNFKEGKVHMVTSKMLGFDRDEENNIIIDEAEAEIVRNIYTWYLDGYSHEKIATMLNEQGYKTKAFNKPYYAGAVLSILSNEKYTGDAILQKTIRKQIGSYNNIKNQTKKPKFYVENSHPGIVDHDTWNKVQQLRKSKAKHYLKATTRKTVTEKARNRTIYNGLAKCDVCGSNYQFKRNNINKHNETRVLICKNNKYNKKCANDIVNADPFDEALLSHINSIIRDKGKFFQRLNVAFKTHPEVVSLKEEIKALEGKINALQQKIIRYLNDAVSYTHLTLPTKRIV